MILRAKWVLPISAPLIEDGAVAVAGDKIVAVGPHAEVCASQAGPVRDLGEVVLLPGLINAHCHLDYSCLHGEVPWHGSFTEWLLRLVALKRLKSAEDYQRGFRQGLEDLVQSGVTTVVNIESFPWLMDEFQEAPVRILWCLELLDADRPGEAERVLAEAEAWLDQRAWVGQDYGFSPHAPYTTSAALYRLSAGAAQRRGVLLTTHLAESAEEDDMIRRGTGPMYDHFRRAGRDMTDCKHAGSVQLLNGWQVLGPRCLAAHVNCVTPLDIRLLQQTGTHVVHCPKTHRFFHRDRPMLPAFWAAGINVCLGTDSAASNDRLNLFDEMRTLAHWSPELSAQRILELATRYFAESPNDGIVFVEPVMAR